MNSPTIKSTTNSLGEERIAAKTNKGPLTSIRGYLVRSGWGNLTYDAVTPPFYPPFHSSTSTEYTTLDSPLFWSGLWIAPRAVKKRGDEPINWMSHDSEVVALSTPVYQHISQKFRISRDDRIGPVDRLET